MEKYANVNEILSYLKERSMYFNRLSSDENSLYQEINNISKEQIKYMTTLYREGKGPVVILRLLLLLKLEKGEKITAHLIQTIKDKFREKDLEYFKPYLNSTQISSILKYNDNTSPFNTWPDFRVLYALLYYGEWKEKVKSYLEIIGNRLKSGLNIRDYNERIIGFDGFQKQGSDELHLIIFPDKFNKYQETVFYYLDITNGKLFAGLGTGEENQVNANIPKEFLRKEYQTIEEVENDFKKYRVTEQTLNKDIDNRVNNANIPTKYWAAGTHWGEEDKIAEFNQNKCWKIGHDKNSENKGARQAWESIKKISVGDYLAFKSYGGKDDLTIKQISKITGKNEVEGEIYFEKISDDNIFKGRGLKNDNIGWFGTLFQITNPKTIETIFGKGVFMSQDQTVSLAKELSELLKKTHNIILHGAPGTGKTFLAHQIAEEMSAEQEFIQFHPSYDYTDFVEGLRPNDKNQENGQIAFKRTDGIFKEFCMKALKNLQDSTKTNDEIKKENSINEVIESFIQDAIEKKKELKIAYNKFFIEEMTEDKIIISTPDNSKIKGYQLSIANLKKILEVNHIITKVKEIKDYVNRKVSRAEDSYLLAIYGEIRKILTKYQSPKKNISFAKIERKNYVFIIDEINRGDFSKIFGELFFALEPSYRGKRIKTQYQNLTEEDNLFYEGFCVPENVYIIGTMNNIDRSVENMDFAFRRRFTFIEISADKTAADILAQLDEGQRNKCEHIMRILNNEISKIDSLGSPADYHIGAAYFLKLKQLDYDYEKFWDYHLKGLFKEYFRGMENATDLLGALELEYKKQIYGQSEDN